MLVLVGLMLVLGVAPASAGVEKNPRVFVGTDVMCGGESLGGLLATGQAGHASDGTLGVAVYVEITNIGPDAVPVFGSFPLNNGLAGITTECSWSGEGLDFHGYVILT